MKKKDLIVVFAALGLALVMFVLFKAGVLTPPKQAQVETAPDPLGINVSLVGQDGQQSNTTLHAFRRDMVRVPASSYLVLTVGRRVYEPIPLTEGRFNLVIDQPDGMQNIALLDGGEVLMHSATCENQKCVQQGMVSLQNRDYRALYSQIICTPNQVVLDVLSEEEAKAAYGEGT